MSIVAGIADAVASSLNDADFGQEFTAERLHPLSFTLVKLDTLRVSVVPKSLTIANATRQHPFLIVSVTLDSACPHVGRGAPERLDVPMIAVYNLDAVPLDHN